jgi:hypothetical protein
MTARWRGVLAAASLLAGCAGAGLSLTEKPMTADEMPVTFAYGGLNPGQAVYRAAVEPRRGTQVRRMMMRSDTELAVFDVVTLLGDYVFVGSAVRPWVEAQLARAGEGKSVPIAWETSGQLGGVRRTFFETFTVGHDRLRCVAIERSLREHIETASDIYSQERVTGLYCRDGGAPIDADEAGRIADALRTRG